MSDPFLERLRAASKLRGRITKLRTLYERHPDTPEGLSALRKARRLEAELGATVEPQREGTPKPNVPNDSYFGAFAKAFKHNFPGDDDEDYSKYARDKDVKE